MLIISFLLYNFSLFCLIQLHVFLLGLLGLLRLLGLLSLLGLLVMLSFLIFLSRIISLLFFFVISFYYELILRKFKLRNYRLFYLSYLPSYPFSLFPYGPCHSAFPYVPCPEASSGRPCPSYFRLCRACGLPCLFWAHLFWRPYHFASQWSDFDCGT